MRALNLLRISKTMRYTLNDFKGRKYHYLLLKFPGLSQESSVKLQWRTFIASTPLENFFVVVKVVPASKQELYSRSTLYLEQPVSNR